MRAVATMLKKHEDESNGEISTLKQELKMARKTQEQHYIKLEAEAKFVKKDLEKKLKEKEKLLRDSKLKIRELKTNSQSKSNNWSKKEHIYESVLDLQSSGLQELKNSSESIKQEMLKAKRTYLEELNCVGTKIKRLAEAAQNYHELLNENRKLHNELQDLKGRHEEKNVDDTQVCAGHWFSNSKFRTIQEDVPRAQEERD